MPKKSIKREEENFEQSSLKQDDAPSKLVRQRQATDKSNLSSTPKESLLGKWRVTEVYTLDRLASTLHPTRKSSWKG